MSLTDATSRVLTVYQASAADHIAELKRLKGAITEQQQAELEAHEARNSQSEAWLKGLAKISAGLFAFKEVSSLAWDGYKTGIEEARLANAAMGVSIDSLKDASHGLLTEHQLLTIAAKENHSAFKLNQEQMDVSVKAMIALQRRGIDAQEAIDAVTTAMVSGKTRGLEPYGIVVNKHIQQLQDLGEENLTLAQRQEIFNDTYRQLAKLSGDVVDGQDAVGESMERTQVNLKNSWENMKKALGGLVEAMQPLLDALSTAVDLVAKVAKAAGGGAMAGAVVGSFIAPGIGTFVGAGIGYLGQQIAGAIPTGGKSLLDEYYAAHPPVQAKNPIPGLFGFGGYANGGNPYGSENAYNFTNDFLFGGAPFGVPGQVRSGNEFLDNYNKAATEADIERIKAAQKAAEQAAKELAEFNKQLNKYAGQPMTGIDLIQAASDSFVASNPIDMSHGASDRAALEQTLNVQSGADRYAAFNAKQSNSFLEKSFGKLSDFDAYSEAFKALSGAVGASLNAWIDGSASAGQAFKKFIADALKGLASQMLVESLKHGAYALGSLAFGDFRGAALHGEAAAAFGVGAAAAAVAAKELGGGGNAGSSAGGGSRPSAPNVGGSGSGGVAPQQTVIVVGDAFANDSPYMRQVTATKIVAAATAGSAGGHG